MKIKPLILCSLLSVVGSAHAEPFWDVELGVENDDNWNRASQQRGKREDTIYQLGLKYGYSQGLSPLSGLLYSVSLERHQWRDYALLNNTELTAGISYQKRLFASLRSPWVALNGDVAYARYRDAKRRASQYEISADIGQYFNHWHYQASLGWRENSARAEAFSTEASYITLGAGIKASNSLSLGVDIGFESGDVVSSVGMLSPLLRPTAQTRDDALGDLNWTAYRADGETWWNGFFMRYGWHGQHELSGAVQFYDSDVDGLNYRGKKLSLFYTRLF